MKPEAEYRTHLAGGKFRPSEAQAMNLELEDDTHVQLKRESDNAYDPNAIKVIAEGHHIGYVPKDYASEIAPWMDTGYEFDCRVVGRMAPLMPFLVITPIGTDEELDQQADESGA